MHRHRVIVVGNCNRLQSITDLLVIVITISVSKHHIIAIAINYIARVITIFMTATIKYKMWLPYEYINLYFVAKLSV